MKRFLSILLLFPLALTAQQTISASFPLAGTPRSGTPTFSPGAGSYGSTQSVTISATGGSVICYNTTGTFSATWTTVNNPTTDWSTVIVGLD
jgi:hypothetical protein